MEWDTFRDLLTCPTSEYVHCSVPVLLYRGCDDADADASVMHYEVIAFPSPQNNPVNFRSEFGSDPQVAKSRRRVRKEFVNVPNGPTAINRGELYAR